MTSKFSAKLGLRSVLLGLFFVFPALCLSQDVVATLPAFLTYPEINAVLGDGFVANGTSTQIKVKLLGNAAGATGVLYFRNPMT
nr:hypothetical protein [Fibrobacterota bacterium]